MASNEHLDEQTAKWLSGTINRRGEDGIVLPVARKDLSAEDYAKGIAETREAFRRNKDRSWVLQILEECIADAHLQRTAK